MIRTNNNKKEYQFLMILSDVIDGLKDIIDSLIEETFLLLSVIFISTKEIKRMRDLIQFILFNK